MRATLFVLLAFFSGATFAHHCGSSVGTWQAYQGFTGVTQYPTAFAACEKLAADNQASHSTLNFVARHVTARECWMETVNRTTGALGFAGSVIYQACGNDHTGMGGFRTTLDVYSKSESPSGGTSGPTITGPVYQCTSGNCTIPITQTVTHVIDWPDSLTGLTAEKVADYSHVWGAFLLAAVLILGAKALYNRFRIDHHD